MNYLFNSRSNYITLYFIGQVAVVYLNFCTTVADAFLLAIVTAVDRLTDKLYTPLLR